MHSVSIGARHASRACSLTIALTLLGTSSSAQFVQGEPFPLNEKDQLIAMGLSPGDAFGYDVDVDGDRAVVSTPIIDLGAGVESGAAFIYERDMAGDWQFVVPLTASDGAAFDQFGTSVSLFGDRIVVGAPGVVHGGPTTGAAYVYDRDTSGNWVEAPRLIGTGLAGSGSFGWDVELDGNRLVVGAPSAVNPAAGGPTGAAYVFEYDFGLSAFSQVQEMFAADAQLDDGFGFAVDIDGEVVVVGAYLDDHPGGGTDAGSIYVFERQISVIPPTVQWTQSQKLVGSAVNGLEFFGLSVAISGTTIVASAPLDTYLISTSTTVTQNTGTVFVFELTGSPFPTGWAETEIIRPSQASGDFGISLDIDANRIVVGAELDEGAEGAAFLYQRTSLNPSWAEVRKLEASAPAGADRLGWSTAISGDFVVVGGTQDIASPVGTGVAYAFDAGGPLDSLVATPSTLSLAAGGTQAMQLDAGSGLAGNLYLVYGSMTLDLSLPPSLLPFWFGDPYFGLFPKNNNLFSGFIGLLDGQGQAQPSLNIPAGLDPTLSGSVLYHAAIVDDGAAGFITDVVAVRLLL